MNKTSADSQTGVYSDKRSSFFKKWFESALSFEDYLKTASESQRENWTRYQKLISLDQAQLDLLSSFKRRMNVLVLSGTWCGDCARQGPMIQAIAAAAPVIQVRFVENRTNPELQDELRINGAAKVPVVVVLSEDFFELSRFGDKHLGVYRSKAARELGPACDAGILPPSDDELCQELTEWLAHFERLQLMLRLAPMLRRRYND